MARFVTLRSVVPDTVRRKVVPVLVEDVVHPDARFAQAVAEEFDAEHRVADQPLFEERVRDPPVLVVVGVGAQDEAFPEDERRLGLRRLAEIGVVERGAPRRNSG